MTRAPEVLLVPDLPLEGWRSMDRYAAALASRLSGAMLAPEAQRIAGPRYWARYVRYPRALRRYRPGVVHVLDHTYAHCLAAFPDTPSVVTVHDLWLAHVARQRGTGARARVRDLLLRRSLRWVQRAHALVAVSQFTADELCQLTLVDRSRVTVVANGVDQAFFAPSRRETVMALRSAWLTGAALGPDTAVLLHVGSCDPRKNVEALLRAAREVGARGGTCMVVQVGGRFTLAQRALAESAGLAGRVQQLPDVDEETLRSAYQAADLLVVPSLYEGFGLPVLEAMAAGLPVVSSGAGGLHEAGAEAVAVVDPQPDRLADVILALLADPERRAAMRARGVALARLRTWDRTAAALREVYSQVASLADRRAR